MMINRDLLFQIAHDLKRLADAAETFLSIAAAEDEPTDAAKREDRNLFDRILAEELAKHGFTPAAEPEAEVPDLPCGTYTCTKGESMLFNEKPVDQTFCDCGEPKDAEFARCANCERMMRKAEARSQSRTLEDLHNEENTPA